MLLDQFPGSAAMQEAVISLRSHLDYIFDITAYDELDNPIPNYSIAELNMYFLSTQVTKIEDLVDNPIVTHQGPAVATHYLGMTLEDETLADGRPIPTAGGLGIRVSNLIIGSPISAIGCEACGTSSVWVCSPSETSQTQTSSQCVSEEEVAQLLDQGGYCGECKVTSEIPALPPLGKILLSIMIVGALSLFLWKRFTTV
jgi:hypothetical protein